jgi:lysophospholipase L1-like esterase
MRFVRQVTERPHLSGILGTQPYAIPFRLEAHTGRAVIPVDLTGGGLSYRRLGHHLEQIGARLALLAPDLLVVNLGAIDFAMGDPSSLFRDNVRAGLARVAALAPATRLLVTGVPDVVSVLRMADVPARRGGDGTVISCGRLHRAARLGLHTGLVGDEPGPEQVAAEYARQRAYEQILSEAVDEIAAAGYAGRIRYVPSRFPIHPEYLGTDCLHPNQRGHAELAAHYWPAVVALLGD